MSDEPGCTIYYLEISTFRGFGEGRHFYGRITNGQTLISVDLEHPISVVEAIRRNREDLRIGLGSVWKPGSMSRGFETEGEVISAAIDWFERNTVNNKALLLRGNYATADPLAPLAGDLEIARRARSLYAAWGDGWEGNRIKAIAVASEWDKFMEEICQ